MSKLASKLCAVMALSQLVSCSLSILPAGAQEHAAKPHIDLAFCIDTTGSMQGELDNVKAKTKEIVAKLAGGKPSPVIRVGLVAYRDRGDEYVTKIFPFTEDIDKVVKDISSLKADGGGDTPESLNEGLHVAVNDLKWDASKKTVKLLFVIGDAGPHAYANDYDWKTESKKAIGQGIQINTVGCQGLEATPEADGVGVFKEIARLADGKYEPLAYRSEVVAADGRKETVISSGGSLYKLKSKSEDWKAGASALTASGGAVRMASPMAMSPAVRMRRSGFGVAAPSAMMSEGTAAGGAYAGASVDRRDNNLADLVLQATKDAANKKLKLEFNSK